jgi:hypothetical protein
MKYTYLSIKVPIYDGINNKETVSTEDCRRLREWANLGRFVAKILKEKLNS